MSTPSSPNGGSIDLPSDWLDDLIEPLEKFVGASAGEARAIGGGIRRVFSGERMEQALQAIRTRLTRDGTIAAPEQCASFALREQVRNVGLEQTIEHWGRHSVAPPSIKL